MSNLDPNQMSFFEHLEELRIRLLWSAGIWLIVFVACFYLVEDYIFPFLAEPLVLAVKNEHVFGAVDIKEPFMANLKAAFWVSVIASSWIFFYNLWAFVAPGLTKSEKRFAVPFIIFMAIFFLVGCTFSFTQVFPYALDYLIGWNRQGFDAYTRTSYLSILFTFVFGMGASFELPLVVFFFAKLRLVTPAFLMAQFKYAVIIIFTIAAIITPTPDIYMQTFLAVPMLLLYLLGVAAAWVVQRNDDKDEPEDDEDDMGNLPTEI